jgi:hypothetical protein
MNVKINKFHNIFADSRVSDNKCASVASIYVSTTKKASGFRVFDLLGVGNSVVPGLINIRFTVNG